MADNWVIVAPDPANTGISDIQRQTPPGARGMALGRWLAERGTVWDARDGDAVLEAWQAEREATPRRRGRAA
jgi:hypothetical protein